MNTVEIVVLCIYALGVVVAMFFTFWIVQQEPICSVSFGIETDVNLGSDLFQNTKINGVSITAPCGSDLYDLLNTAQWGTK